MGRWVWMIAVHSSTRVWQDMVVLLVSLGLVETPRMFPRGLSGHHFYTHYPKNLPLKGRGDSPLTGNWDLRAWLLVPVGATPVCATKRHDVMKGNFHRLYR